MTTTFPLSVQEIEMKLMKLPIQVPRMNELDKHNGTKRSRMKGRMRGTVLILNVGRSFHISILAHIDKGTICHKFLGIRQILFQTILWSLESIGVYSIQVDTPQLV